MSDAGLPRQGMRRILHVDAAGAAIVGAIVGSIGGVFRRKAATSNATPSPIVEPKAPAVHAPAYEVQGSYDFNRPRYRRPRAIAQAARGAANRKAKNRALRLVQAASRARNRRA